MSDSLSFLGGEIDFLALSEDEEQRVFEYAALHDLKTGSLGDLAVWCAMTGSHEAALPSPRAFVLPEQPIGTLLTETFGVLTLASFVSSRGPGWEERDALQAAHNHEIVGLTETERIPLRKAIRQRISEFNRTARRAEQKAFEKRAHLLLVENLIGRQHIPPLSAQVQELREQLNRSVALLRGAYSAMLYEWFEAAFAVEQAGGASPLGRAFSRVGRFRSSVEQGLPPARAMFNAERLMRLGLGVPEVVIKAQLGGLAHLLLGRERMLIYAARVRSELSIYEPLLHHVLMETPPLDPEAMKALAEVQKAANETRRDWEPNLADARANSVWGPLVPFLAKAVQERPGASRVELAAYFGTVCERYDKSQEYCQKKSIDPAAINLSQLSRYKKEAVSLLDRVQE